MNENKENTNVVPTENTQTVNQLNANSINNQPSVSNNTIQNPGTIPQGLSTTAPEPQVAVQPQPQPQPQPQITPQNSTQPQPQQQNTVQQPEQKEGTFKYVLAFIFIIAFAGFVIFIPEISKFVKSKIGGNKGTETENLIENGTLICEKDKSTDETDIKYELKYTFDNKKLLTSSYVTTYESLNSELLKQKNTECNLIMTTSKTINGIETTCNDKNGILKISEEYTNQDIDRSNLTAYTEAGGTYPEFEYGENVYNIQSTLVKQGYDCKVSSVQE